MSVDYTRRFMLGWIVETDSNEKFAYFTCEWDRVFGSGAVAPLRNIADRLTNSYGRCVYVEDLVGDVSQMQDEGWFVGIPMPSDTMPLDKFEQNLDAMRRTAREVYRCVYGHDPDKQPSIMVFDEVD